MINAPTVTNDTLTEGLVGHWTFDGNETQGTVVVDRSGNGNNGTRVGAPQNTEGRFGQALRFNGTSNFVSIPNTPSLRPTTAITVSAWIKTLPKNLYPFIVSKKYDTDFESYGLSDFTDVGTNIGFCIKWGAMGNEYTCSGVASESLGFWNDSWVHVVGTYDKSFLRIYVNGGEVGSGTPETRDIFYGTSPDNIFIGSFDAAKGFFSGSIDDVRIYNRALPPEDIFTLSQRGKHLIQAAPENSLSQGILGYWKFDEGAGTGSVSDASGNATALTMYSFANTDWTTGKVGPFSLNFDGVSKRLAASDPPILDFDASKSFTLTGWFYRNSLSATHTILAKRNGTANTDDGYILSINGATDQLIFEASDNADTDEYQIASASLFNVPGWNHFAIVWDDDSPLETTMYTNGQKEAASKTGTLSSIGNLSNALAFTIGAESDGGNPFDGRLDDIRVYGYPLSTEEIGTLFRTGAPAEPVDTQVIGHWTFDGPDIQGTRALDRSKNSLQGTLTNGPQPAIGRLGQALRFDGVDDFVSLGDTPLFTLDPSKNYTWSMWIRGSDYSGTFQNILWSQVQDTNNALLVSARSISGHPDFGSVTDGLFVTWTNAGSICSGEATTDSVLEKNAWTHIVLQYEGTLPAGARFSIWVNSVDRSKNTNASHCSPGSINPTVTALGNNGTLPSQGFEGSLDDIRLYDRLLTAEEIHTLFHSGTLSRN